MNVRSLMDWGIVIKVVKSGDSKEFFFSDKDIWDSAKQIRIRKTETRD